MKNKHSRKNSTLMVKHVSIQVIKESHSPIKDRVIASSRVAHTTPKGSEILVVETKKERTRTIKEYEKQRDIIRSVIAR